MNNIAIDGADIGLASSTAGDRGDPWRGETRNAKSASIPLATETTHEARLAAIKASVNPLLEAAQPLLRALADMPMALDSEQIDVFRRLLEREVTLFQAVCSNAQIRHEHWVAASYALCTAIDEAVNCTEWGGGSGANTGVWASHQLAQKFHDDNKGGEKVFLLIGRLAASAQEHIDLLDLMFFILGLGFEGRYRAAANGRRQLETIRNRLFEAVMSARGEVPRELSPHWKGEGTGRFRMLRSIPVWVTASLLALALLALLSWYKYQLLHTSSDVEERVRAIGALQPPPPPPPPAHKSLRLRELLAPEIARGSVSVEEEGDEHSAVSFKGDDMFEAGQARVNAKLLPTIAKVANEVNEVSGTVRVTGHSDNQPIKTREFPNNQALSEKRAAAVAEVLRSSAVAAERLQVEGKGDTKPLADNATAAGRARNRRVDIVVTQGNVVAHTATVSAPSAPPKAASPQ